ncbi:Uncharacterised protein [Mycobacteroides abscessus subsp. abscessus]|nr:Uncharacterised protein [Mycobacteroides abscessus subsp. abscessus]
MADKAIDHESDPFLAASAKTAARYEPLTAPPAPAIGTDPASAATEAAFTEWFAQDAEAEAELAARAERLHQTNIDRSTGN